MEEFKVGTRVCRSDAARSNVGAYRLMRGTVASVSESVVMVAWDMDGPLPLSVQRPEWLKTLPEPEQVCGYEFVLRMNGQLCVSQLQGSGGAIGNGALVVQGYEGALEVAHGLLMRARRNLSRDGHVLSCNDRKHDEKFEVREITPEEIVYCRPIFVDA